MTYSIRKSVAGILLLCAAAAVQADEIHLRNGQVIKDVSIIDQVQEDILYRDSFNGPVRQLKKSTLKRVVYSPTDLRQKFIKEREQKLAANRARLRKLQRRMQEKKIQEEKSPDGMIERQKGQLDELKNSADAMKKTAELFDRRQAVEDRLKGKQSELDQLTAEADRKRKELAALNDAKSEIDPQAKEKLNAMTEEMRLLERRLSEQKEELERIKAEKQELTGELERQRGAFRQTIDAHNIKINELKEQLAALQRSVKEHEDRRVELATGKARERLIKTQIQADTKDIDLARKSGHEETSAKLYRGGIWRSAAFPGWGQFYRNEKIKGGIFVGLFAASTGYFFTSRRELIAARNDFAQPLLPYAFLSMGQPGLVMNAAYFDEKQAAVDRAQGKMNMALGLTLGVYLWNLVDALLWSPESGPSPVADKRTSRWDIRIFSSRPDGFKTDNGAVWRYTVSF